MNIKNIVVGCGFSGAVIARKIAEESDEEVLIIERKEHIAGNSYDYNDGSVTIHKYGPHIFHTNNQSVWNYLGRFTKWALYSHKVEGFIEGNLVPIPFNLNSIERVFPASMTENLNKKLIVQYGYGKKVPIWS